MSYIIHMESTTTVCSVSLAKSGKLIASKTDFDGQNHAKLIGLFVEQLLHENNINPKQLAAIAVSEGPGSYTGLRIGTSHAKGMCYALNIPLIAINPLQALCKQALSRKHAGIKNPETAHYIALMDARRMEVYTATFNSHCQMQTPIEAKIIDENSFMDANNENEIVIFGNGAAKCAQIMKHPQLHHMEEVHCHADDMCELAHEAFLQKTFVDVAYFEPLYLKDFVVLPPKQSIFEKI